VHTTMLIRASIRSGIPATSSAAEGLRATNVTIVMVASVRSSEARAARSLVKNTEFVKNFSCAGPPIESMTS
jgi:hypothetical protein